MSFNLSRFVGPALAGFVIALAGVGTAFVINGISYLAMIIAMIVLRQKPSAHSADRRKHPRVELLGGARYALSHPLIRSLLVLAAERPR